jgi:hypothetical protein
MGISENTTQQLRRSHIQYPTRTAIAGDFGSNSGNGTRSGRWSISGRCNSGTGVFLKANSDIAVQIMNPVKKENVAMNLYKYSRCKNIFTIYQSRTDSNRI